MSENPPVDIPSGWPWVGIVLATVYLAAVFALPCIPAAALRDSGNRKPYAQETQNATEKRPGPHVIIVQANATDAKTQSQTKKQNNSDCVICGIWAALGRFVADLGDPVALFTGALVIISAWQGLLILRAESGTQEALKISKRQAEASLLSAKNLLRSVRPLCVLVDITLETFSGAVPDIELPAGYYLKSVHGMIKNKGNGTAFAREIQLASCVGAIGAKLEPEGKSTTVFAFYELKADEVYFPPMPLYPIPLTAEAERGDTALFVWGWLRYADIHGIVRRSGFAFQWWTLGDVAGIPATFIPCGPASYWYDIEEESEP